eukprot:INCI9602.1.p1 GENE.INCI9602.1~~INCI9602.1.p1  ORF type:complete len:267 (+),score=31.30 INCI9602.1:286-1086(+)
MGETGNSALHKRGYRSARATHGVMHGAWYYEVTCLKGNFPHGHMRLGWATSKSNLDLPVGYGPDSYAYRDVNGDRVTRSFREPYGKAFGWTEDKGSDVISCYINLGSRDSGDGSTVSSQGKQAASSVPSSSPASSGAAESAGSAHASPKPSDQLASTSDSGGLVEAVINHTPPPVSQKNKEPQHALGYVAYFVNGEPQGVAFSGIQLQKKYYPYLSLYNGAEIHVNYGAEAFKFRDTVVKHLAKEGHSLPRAMSEAAIQVKVRRST